MRMLSIILIYVFALFFRLLIPEAFMASTLLAVDVGGTKCELAVFAGEGVEPLARKRYPSADYGGLAEIIAEFLGETGLHPEYACLGIAGVVSGGEATVTNLPWSITEKALAAQFGFAGVRLINDLTAVCASLPLLQPADLLEIQQGLPQPNQLIGVIAPGTGLGEGLLVQGNGFFFPRGSEGGHTDFAPVSEEQQQLLRWMHGRQHPVCYETLIAGPGIPHLYDFYRVHLKMDVFAEVEQRLAAATDRTPVIFESAFAKPPCPLCRRVVELFLSILGSEAGNLALKLYARGGIYIGGGIVPRIADKVSFTGFLDAFQDKDKMVGLMKTIPIHLIRHDNPGLLGAAHYGREQLMY